METGDANFENTNSDTDIDVSSPESFNSTEKEMVDSVKNIETKDKSKTKNKDNLEIDSETENNEGLAPPPTLDIFALKFDTVNAIFTPVIHWLQLLLLLHLYNNCMTMCN